MGSKNFAHFEEKSFWRKMAMDSIPTYVTMYLAIKIILFTESIFLLSWEMIISQPAPLANSLITIEATL